MLEGRARIGGVAVIPASVDRSGNRVGGASRSSESPKPRTDGRTDGLTKNLLTERTSGTFRNAHTRVPDFDADEVEVEALRERAS